MELNEEQKTERQKEIRELGTIKLQGKDYLQVAHRIVLMRTEHPNWMVQTNFETHEFGEEKKLVARAAVANEQGKVIATSTKMVVAGGRGPAAKYPMEMAETGAIGRALALAGYGTLSGDLSEGDQIADAPQDTTRKW